MIYVLAFIAGLSLLFTGLKNTIRALPIIILVSVILFFLGSAFITFLPIIVIFIVLRLVLGKKKVKRTRTYYYNGTNSQNTQNTQNAQDFEEFFRQATGGAYGQSQNNKNTNYGNFGYNVNKDQYYKELGVTKESTPEEIKKAYRSMAMKYHPDKANNLDDESKKKYEAKFKKINEAYENLK